MTKGSGGIRAEGLGKRFGELWALQDLDLDVPAGTVLGLLGHNGAGKTTAIRILTTLSQPTTGWATVDGIDVAADPGAVRSEIGVAGQAATVDGLLSGRKNLELVARLHHLSRGQARDRADELLDQLDLADAKDKLVKEYSGGMRRRLDLAASIVTTPSVLFLDEPTTGLDPRSRNDLWDVLRGLVRGGTTILLTTQYLEEADLLADDIVVLDHGRTVAHGSPAELKSQVGNERIELSIGDRSELDAAVSAVTPFASSRPTVDAEARHLILPVRPGVRLMEVLRALDTAGIDAIDINRREATLDDVFLTLTGAERADLEVPAPA
jgi:ABC-2 type transport system ATP-binding protein